MGKNRNLGRLGWVHVARVKEATVSRWFCYWIPPGLYNLFARVIYLQRGAVGKGFCVSTVEGHPVQQCKIF